jgi:2-isopropylmalate synthase
MSRTEPAGTPLGDAFHVYDTTLRDGAQREGISYSVADKLAVARHLDAMGVGYIEGGWPGAMPKDTEFFARAAAGELELRHAALVAFGATRRAGLTAAEDPQVRALLDSLAPVVTLVAKSDRRHVERALRTDVAENCAMVADTVAFLTGEGRRVFLDAEHFFDGYAFDPDTALRVLEAAMGAGAAVAVLCDTNGGMLPLGIAEVVTEVAARTVSDSASTARTTPAAPWATPSPPSRPAPPTCSAPPTATGSGPATPTCSPWSGTW